MKNGEAAAADFGALPAGAAGDAHQPESPFIPIMNGKVRMHHAPRQMLIPALVAVTLGTGEMRAQTPEQRAAAMTELNSRVPGLVKVFVRCGGGWFMGGGVVVSDSGDVLTAAHVGNACIGQTTEVWVGRPQRVYDVPGRTHRADIVQRVADGVTNPTQNQSANSRRQDVALLRVRANQPPLPFARISRELPLPGDPIRVAGFANLPFQVADSTRAEGGLSIFHVQITSVAATAQDRPTRLHYSGGSWPGMSGGPVYNARGELIGIHSARAMLDVTGLLNTNCDPATDPNRCWGNAVAFDYLAPGNLRRRQIIQANFDAVRGILDNYAWATSVHAIPEDWLR